MKTRKQKKTNYVLWEPWIQTMQRTRRCWPSRSLTYVKPLCLMPTVTHLWRQSSHTACLKAARSTSKGVQKTSHNFIGADLCCNVPSGSDGPVHAGQMDKTTKRKLTRYDNINQHIPTELTTLHNTFLLHPNPNTYEWLNEYIQHTHITKLT